MTAILEVKGLVKTYGRRRVVDGVGFSVEHGEIVGLLGPNGAGKTTSFRMTCGMVEPDQGQVLLDGVDVTQWPMFRRARDGGMGYLAQESSVFRKLSVEQNLLGMMELLGISWKKRRLRCSELLEQFKITHIRKSKAGSLSGGERRRLEIARLLVSSPEIILMDEPFTGIDPVTIQSIQEIIRDLRDHGISILITDHQVRETLQITTRSYVISKGKVLCHGTPAEVLAHDVAREEYFGDSMDVNLPGIEQPSLEQPSLEQPSLERPSLEQPSLERRATQTPTPRIQKQGPKKQGPKKQGPTAAENSPSATPPSVPAPHFAENSEVKPKGNVRRRRGTKKQT